MATIVEMLDELEKVRLAPIVLPALKILDPRRGIAWSKRWRACRLYCPT